MTTVAAVLTVMILAVWHLRTRRHPNWHLSSDGRFFITLGYPALAIGVYCLLTAPIPTELEWAVGNAWALLACVLFVYGFKTLNGARKTPETGDSSEQQSPEGPRSAESRFCAEPIRRTEPRAARRNPELPRSDLG